jgi:nitrate/nitrite-specific signal transduction histidine kinase
MRFNPKISTLEERSNINSIRMDELHGIFTAYEMRTEQENPDVKEATFKAFKISKQNEKKQEEHSNNSDVSEYDEEVDKFVKRLNKGTNNRYRGKISLFFLIVMVLVILLTNVLIRKREMMKVTQKENKHIKAKELQRKFSRKSYAPKKTSHHQMKMKSVTVRHEEFYSWK